ncbi:MAG TPA: hypothetical protein VFT53_00985 [Candidatus Saccharimonadales bacterium]|nr:hypothetical protein [Candidatus Saccharimonadales bacterium]
MCIAAVTEPQKPMYIICKIGDKNEGNGAAGNYIPVAGELSNSHVLWCPGLILLSVEGLIQNPKVH